MKIFLRSIVIAMLAIATMIGQETFGGPEVLWVAAWVSAVLGIAGAVVLAPSVWAVRSFINRHKNAQTIKRAMGH